MKNKRKGFTIVELVIVIAIVAILTAIIIPVISNAVKKAKTYEKEL
jgi:prepilin-type N-terminal cleavage/methylation domain-containing protein